MEPNTSFFNLFTIQSVTEIMTNHANHLLVSKPTIIKSFSAGFANSNMRNQIQNGGKLLEEQDLLHQAHPGRPQGETSRKPPDSSNRRRLFCLRKWKGFHVLGEIRRQSRCLVCLQVHQVKDLPPHMNGKDIIVGWRTKGWEGEQTMPVRVCQGVASFDEIFLHYCNIKVPSTLKSFSIRVSLPDSKESDLGTFRMGLGEEIPVGNTNSKFSGKTVSFNLCGMAARGKLTVSFCYTVIGPEPGELQRCTRSDSTGPNSRWCFSCLSDLKHSKNRQPTGSTRVSSLESDLGFITIENSTQNISKLKNEDEGFITIEKGIIRTRSRRPPSDDLKSSEDGNLIEFEKENRCFLAGLYEESEVYQVESEFLKMLEETRGKTGEGEKSEEIVALWENGLEGKLNVGFDLDLDAMIKEAENELVKAAQVWTSGAAARQLEMAEYEELMKRWASARQLKMDAYEELVKSWASDKSVFEESFNGFGSPI